MLSGCFMLLYNYEFTRSQVQSSRPHPCGHCLPVISERRERADADDAAETHLHYAVAHGEEVVGHQSSQGGERNRLSEPHRQHVPAAKHDCELSGCLRIS